MAKIHVLKNTKDECVVKCYSSDNSDTLDIGLANTVCRSDETFDANNAIVTIREIFWGCKKDKQIDITRVATANTVHGHYYLINSGSYDFVGFVDDVYADKDIRIIADGPFHVIMKLGKVKGFTKT